MMKIALWNLLCLFLLSNAVVYAQTDVLMQHNDLNRTGWNNQETTLNTTNVKAGTFGKIFTCNVDDKIYAQPLVVTGVSTSLGVRNVVYVATVNNSLYAFDADSGTQIWHVNFTPPTFRPPNSNDIHATLCTVYNDFSGGQFGIVGTPAIDKNTGTLYVVSRDADPTKVDNSNQCSTCYPSTGFTMRLHKIDIGTGADKIPPVVITAQTAGTGDGSQGGFITFDPRRNNQRGGLVLSNGIVYITFAAHCDWGYYHGWILGYDTTALIQKVAYSNTPNSSNGGIWMSGAAPAVDATGNLYVAAGNGGANPTQLTDRGESVIKLAPNIPGGTLNVSDYFTPFDFALLNSGDLDLPIQVMLVPGTNLAISGCKDGNLYVMNTVNPPGLGGFNSGFDNLQQKILVASGAQMHSSFAYFGGSSTKYFYQFSEATALSAYSILRNKANTLDSVNTTPVTGPTGPTGLAGAYMSVSSNGGDPATGILWVSHASAACNANQGFCPGVLRAINASNITQELWNSAINPADAVDTFAKNDCPTIANGKVYIGSNGKQSKLMVFGLTASNPCPGMPNEALKINNSGTNYSAMQNYGSDNADAVKAFDGDKTTSWQSNYDDDDPNLVGWKASLTVNLGKKFDLCSIVIYFGNINTQNFVIEASVDSSSFTTLESVTNNGFPTHTLILQNQSYQFIRFRPLNRYNSTIAHIVEEMEVYGQPTNACLTPTGFAWNNSDQNDGNLTWQAVTGVNAPTSFNIQYQVPIVDSWRTTTSSTNSVSLNALTCSSDYMYNVQAVCPSGPSNIASGTFSNSACSAPCGTRTRYEHADIGEIGIAGSYCYSVTGGTDTTYTVTGSGTDIGGSSDQFQYVFTNLAGDEEVTARVFSFDANSPATSKAGLMMRDSMTFTSRFAFIGITKNNNAIFEYRSVAGGPTNTVTMSGITWPYYVRLIKSGTQYSAFISPTGADNSWTQVGTTQDLSFGVANSVNVGPAVTSTNNGILSTAVIDQFLIGSGTPLPITLLNFSASNVNNNYISLRWATSMEQNNDHFEVERSNDGVQFETIASVKAVGNSDVTQYYSTEDPNPLNGINFYRLKQVDLDGRATYSYVVSVRFGDQAIPVIFPNPTTSDFTIVAGAEPINEIEIYDISGKLIQRLSNSGNSSIKISSSQFASGIYIVQMRTASTVYRQKLSKN